MKKPCPFFCDSIRGFFNHPLITRTVAIQDRELYEPTVMHRHARRFTCSCCDDASEIHYHAPRVLCAMRADESGAVAYVGTLCVDRSLCLRCDHVSDPSTHSRISLSTQKAHSAEKIHL